MMDENLLYYISQRLGGFTGISMGLSVIFAPFRNDLGVRDSVEGQFPSNRNVPNINHLCTSRHHKCL